MELYEIVKLSKDQKQTLVEEVVEQIKKDLEDNDVTAIEEMLHSVQDMDLIGFLGHEEGKKYFIKR